jgi:hypothetical protein
MACARLHMLGSLLGRPGKSGAGPSAGAAVWLCSVNACLPQMVCQQKSFARGMSHCWMSLHGCN